MENSSNKETAMRLREVAEGAVKAIGLGFDIVDDLRLKFCKDYQLISVDHDQVRDISIPGGILVQNVPKSINCDKGERMRFTSDILSFSQVSFCNFFLIIYLTFECRAAPFKFAKIKSS